MTEFITEYASILIAAGGFTIFLLVLFGLFGEDPQEQALAKRVSRIAPHGLSTSTATSGTSVVRGELGDGSALEKMSEKYLPQPKKLKSLLEQSGSSMGPGVFVSITLVLVLFIFTVSIAMMKLPLFIALSSAISSGIGLPYMVIRKKATTRKSQFIELLPDALNLICRGLRAGLPVMESISTVGQELQDPLGHEFRELTAKVHMGATLEDGLWEMERRLPSNELQFLITAISIQRETGGNLAETLGNLSDLLRKRRQFKLKVKAMSSEAKASAYIIGSLPFLMFGILMILSPGYVNALFIDPRGVAMLVGSLLMIALGCFIMTKMVSFEA